MRVELTNYAITYRTLWRTRTFALTDLRPPVLEAGEDRSPHRRLLVRNLQRPMIRLVLSPYKHPIKHRIDLNLMQLDPVAMQALIEHLGATEADGDDEESTPEAE